MDNEPDSDTLEALTRETQAIWDRKATYWDEQMGEGNAFQRILVGPASERLLAIRPGETVLDVACGNGVFSRRLAALGARVVACDFSPTFLERARARTGAGAGPIEYRLIDATDEGQLLTLGEGRFDAAVCNMALMDMTTIEPLLRALGRLLKADGRFVFSVPHPCFNSAGVRLTVEEEDRDGELVAVYAVKVANYLRLGTRKGAGMPGEPEPHHYFHRPLNQLLGACFAAGFVLDGLEEPAFDEGTGGSRPLSWANFTNIPPVLVAHLRQPDKQ